MFYHELSLNSNLDSYYSDNIITFATHQSCCKGSMAHDYIATWFYKESNEESSFYPQINKKGSSPLLQSIYMQIQVPFFITFHHYNPQAKLLFFTNLEKAALPQFLLNLFSRTHVEVCTIPYQNKPPKDWYKSWMNQFYVYDILQAMEPRMSADDTLLLCDADCLCHKSLDELFRDIREAGSALYPINYKPGVPINGTTLEEMSQVYTSCYDILPSTPIQYYGGEFIALRGDAVAAINREFPKLKEFNFSRPQGAPRLHEEAHFFSLLAERLHLRNDIGSRYIKRMWASWHFNNIEPGDEELSIWHLPAEKRYGLHYLYRLLERGKGVFNEQIFWEKARIYCGVPHTGLRRNAYVLLHKIKERIK